MQTKLIQWHQAEAAKLLERLQADPGTLAIRVVLKPGMRAQKYNPTIRRLARHEKQIAALVKAGLKQKVP